MSRFDHRPRQNQPGPWYWLIFPVLFTMLALALPGAIWAQVTGSESLNVEPTWIFSDDGNWFTSPIAPSFSIIDGDGLQPASTEYRYSTDGGGTWTSWSSESPLQVTSPISTSAYVTLTLPALPDSATQNQVQLQITDQVSQTNTSPSYTILVDNTAPDAPVGLSADPAAWTSTNSFDLDWTNPADTSGIGGTYYKVGGLPPAAASDWTGYMAGDDLSGIDDLAMTTSGEHNVYVWLEDKTGNSDHANYAITACYLDVDAPEPVTNLAIVPDGWSNVDSFDLTWTNPVEMSGIAGAYYKVGDTPPTDSADWTGYVAGTDISQIDDLSIVIVGKHRVYLWLVDTLGNADHTQYTSTTCHLDVEVPGTPTDLVVDPDDWTNEDAFDLTWTNPTELSGVAGAYYKVGDTPPVNDLDRTGFAAGHNLTEIEDLAIVITGEKSIYLWLIDEAGNSDFARHATATCHLDVDAPAALSGLTVTPDDWSTLNEFTLNWTNPVQDQSGISRAYYTFDDSPTSNSDFAGSAEADGINEVIVVAPEGGAIDCYVWLGDEAGNTDYTTAQMTTLYYSGDDAPGRPQDMEIDPVVWTQSVLFDVSWTNPDVPSGVLAAWYKWGAPDSDEDGTRVTGVDIDKLTDLTIPGEGEWPLYVWLEDSAGQKSYANADSVTAQNDMTAPETEHSFDPMLPTSGWFNVPVTIDLLASDEVEGLAVSGVMESQYRLLGELWSAGDSFLVTEHSTYEYRSVDNALNEEAWHAVEIPVDMDPPTSTLSLVPDEPVSGWYTDALTIVITAEDDGSGWDGESWYRLDSGSLESGALISVTSDGAHSLSYYSVDIAGNTEATQLAPVACRIDSAAPTITYTVTPEEPAGGWYSETVRIDLSAGDTHSGIDSIQYRQEGATFWQVGDVIDIDGSEGDGIYTYEFRAQDLAGNWSNTEQAVVRVDHTGPFAPTDLTSTTDTWIKEDGSFGVNWTNPIQDQSPISGAYYQLDIDPTVIFDPTFVAGENLDSIDNIAVNDEGPHTIYVWLEDAAGNSDPFALAMLENAFHYDGTGPSCYASFTGPIGDDPRFFTGPITITLSGSDGLSGMAEFAYRVDSGDWISYTVEDEPLFAGVDISFDQEERHIIDYRSADVAGNVSAIGSDTIRLDFAAPGSPTDLTPSPAVWTNTNDFDVCWTPPNDYSGVETVYYEVGEAPVDNGDFEYTETLGPAQSCITGITVGQEGNTLLYVWLGDLAGNVDYTTAAPVTLRYDATPPTTAINTVGTEGSNGYHLSSVSVTFDATDGASGVAETYYTVNESQSLLWNGSPVLLDAEGSFDLTFWSVDAAGNEELPHGQAHYKLDLVAPVAAVSVPSNYVSGDSTHVEWQGTDTVQGSGVVSYRVEYRQGGCSPWQTWSAKTNTASTEGTFDGLLRNNFYYFRVRATDKAGNESSWSPDKACYVYREGLGNASFDSGSLGAWETAGELPVTVEDGETSEGGTSKMAKLGYEGEYTDRLTPDSYAAIYQRVQLPSLACDSSLRLSFRYRLMGWDGGGPTQNDPADPFDMTVRDINGQELALLLRDYIEDPHQGTIEDLGWQEAVIDLSPWAGQQVSLEFRIWNRFDEWLPSWVYIDDVSLRPEEIQTIALPFIGNGGGPGMLSGSQSAKHESMTETPTLTRQDIVEQLEQDTSLGLDRGTNIHE